MTPPPSATPRPARKPPRRKAWAPRFCLRCRYDLRAQGDPPRCPECGLNQHLAMREQSLRLADAAWLRDVSIGLRQVCLATPVAALAVAVLANGPAWASAAAALGLGGGKGGLMAVACGPLPIQGWQTLVVALPLALDLAGVWRLTSDQPGDVGLLLRSGRVGLRWAVRLTRLAAVAVAATLLHPGLSVRYHAAHVVALTLLDLLSAVFLLVLLTDISRRLELRWSWMLAGCALVGAVVGGGLSALAAILEAVGRSGPGWTSALGWSVGVAAGVLAWGVAVSIQRQIWALAHAQAVAATRDAVSPA